MDRRTVFLVDMNAFFIMCESARDRGLKGRPAAVAGDPLRRSGIILSANYEARKFGVKTTMLIHEARQLCPDIVLVPPDHHYYDSRSREVMKIFSRYTPVIQQNSIDEAWLDLTGCGALYGKPLEIAGKIMRDILDELDLWCSIGISENKFLAKMACEMKKPMGITELWPEDVSSKMWPLPVGDMYGIGRKTSAKLAGMAVFTIGDIANMDIRVIEAAFGKYGSEMHRLANGIDNSPVTEFPVHGSRSVGRSTTLPADITDIGRAKVILLDLAEEVATEARRLGMPGRTVSIVIKYSNFKSITRQKTIKSTYLSRDIISAGVWLLENNWDDKKPVRLIGISLGGLEEGGLFQASIFDSSLDSAPEYGKEKYGKDKAERLEKAIDGIRRRFGAGKIRRASSLEKP